MLLLNPCPQCQQRERTKRSYQPTCSTCEQWFNQVRDVPLPIEFIINHNLDFLIRRHKYNRIDAEKKRPRETSIVSSPTKFLLDISVYTQEITSTLGRNVWLKIFKKLFTFSFFVFNIILNYISHPGRVIEADIILAYIEEYKTFYVWS